MPIAGKEQEPRINPDELAVKEVAGYIERIERQAETKSPAPATPVQTSVKLTSDDAAKKAIALGPKTQKQQIILPLDEEEVRLGLHHKVIDAVRWLAEWSVLMIKKYPGRVFYPAKQNQATSDQSTQK